MDKSEKIFTIIIIISYIISSIALKIPFFIHILFGSIILGALIIALLLKFSNEHENVKISKIFKAITMILAIYYLTASAYEIYFSKTLFINSTLIMIFSFITLIISWIFKKNKNDES